MYISRNPEPLGTTGSNNSSYLCHSSILRTPTCLGTQYKPTLPNNIGFYKNMYLL